MICVIMMYAYSICIHDDDDHGDVMKEGLTYYIVMCSKFYFL